MFYGNSYIPLPSELEHRPSSVRVTTTEHFYSLPQLSVVPPELEVPDLVIPPSRYTVHPRPTAHLPRPSTHLDELNYKTSSQYGKTLGNSKHCHRIQHYSKARGKQSACPTQQSGAACYRLPDTPQDTPHNTAPHTAPWRQGEEARAGHTDQNKKQWRRKRTVFTTEELAVLTGYYEQNKFLNPGLKAEILAQIDVPGNVLVMWYQNRRAKDRASGIVI